MNPGWSLGEIAPSTSSGYNRILLHDVKNDLQIQFIDQPQLHQTSLSLLA